MAEKPTIVEDTSDVHVSKRHGGIVGPLCKCPGPKSTERERAIAIEGGRRSSLYRSVYLCLECGGVFYVKYGESWEEQTGIRVPG